MSSPSVNIRKATSADLPAIMDLVRELAIFEEAEHMMTANMNTYTTSFEEGHFEALVATHNEEVVGTAIYYRRFSTWKGPILYLEDFVVRKRLRRLGIGKILFEAYIEEARKKGMALCLWQVLDWNQTAINFYDKYDVEYEDNWLNVKLYLK